MCGVTGFYNVHLADPVAALNQSCNLLSHRGPDASGRWFNENLSTGLGHTRLAIRDLSDKSNQPYVSHTGRFVISYNGEIYNVRELLDWLDVKHRGTENTDSDTAILSLLVDKYGVERTCQRLDGMFAMAIYDRLENEIYLIRDSAGIKPLYFYQQEQGIFFSSRIDSLEGLLGRSLEVDPGSAHHYFTFGYTAREKSILQGCGKIEPGSVLICSSNGSSRQEIFRSVKKRQLIDLSGMTYDDCVEQTNEVVSMSVRQQMVSDVPVGCFLSGGIDSSLLASAMVEITNSPVKTFSIGFNQQSFNEAKYAKEISEYLGTRHTELYLSDGDVLPFLDDVVAAFDEPLGDASQIPTFALAKLARAEVGVVMSGDGGDELFCGYDRYDAITRVYHNLRFLPAPVRIAISRIGLSLPAFGIRALTFLLNRALGRAYTPTKVNKLFRLIVAEDVEMIMRAATAQSISPEEFFLSPVHPDIKCYLTQRDKREAAVTEQQMLIDFRSYLCDDLLVKTDRTTMAHSLEARVPFLGNSVVDFAWGVDLSHKQKNGRMKAVLRDALALRMPTSLFERPKQGFSVPLSQWMRGGLRQWCWDNRESYRRQSPILLDNAAIDLLWNRFFNGDDRLDSQVWSQAMFFAWHNRRVGR